MGLGVDIYRYQTVTDWNAVKRNGTQFVIVKGTDGGGPAIVRADSQVRGAKSVGLPVGLYHYAQLSPSPEAQADVLCTEVARLGAVGVPPALDLEDPHPATRASRDFAIRFLRRVRANGFPHVIIYGNTSMLEAIDVESLGVDGTLIWEANFGPNDGRRHALPVKPWTRHIHQYTSSGTVPGISGRVDLNESLAAIPGPEGVTDDMALTDKVTWKTGQSVTVADILAEMYIAARGLRGQPTFDGDTDTVQLPPLVNLRAAIGGLEDDEAKVLAALQGVRGELLTALASIDGTPSDEQVADLAAKLNAQFGGAYSVIITKTPE